MIMINCSLPIFASNTSEFVLTITAPVSENLNSSQLLFRKLKLLTGEVADKTSFASIIDKVGGNWVLTSDMSCVQFALLFPEENESVINAIYNFVSKVSKLDLTLIDKRDSSSCAAIFSNCATMCDLNWNEPISVYVNGLSKSFSNNVSSILASSTYSSDLFNSDIKWLDSLVVKDEKPMSSAVFLWEKNSISNYISAKIIGEKFMKAFNNKEIVRYRIWALPGKLFLVLSIQGSEKVIYENLHKSLQFCNSINSLNIGKSDEWKSFSLSSKRILTEDQRDIMKASLYKGWHNHWIDENDEVSSDIEFVEPKVFQTVLVMPKASMHEVSYSNNSSIGFVGHKYSESNDLVDVVIAIQSKKMGIVKNAFSNADSFSVPVTLKKVKDNILLVAFCAEASAIDMMTKSLYEKVSQLKINVDTSISLVAVGQLAPFILKYKMQTNWKSLEVNKPWAEASEQDIANALCATIDDVSALRGKYLLKIASSRGRAELLAILACQGKKICNFTTYFK